MNLTTIKPNILFTYKKNIYVKISDISREGKYCCRMIAVLINGFYILDTANRTEYIDQFSQISPLVTISRNHLNNI